MSQTIADSATHSAARTRTNELRAFVHRLHFYVGVFVGPFILIAIMTGTLFVLTPQLESLYYADQLQARSSGAPQTLEAQAKAARAHIGEGPRLFAIRPAPEPGATTRVMFTEPGLGGSESRAIFIDPASLEVQGDLIVYGTSGTLPLRTGIDYLHRHLMLGEAGRMYSELAASWLWVLAISGVVMWSWKRQAKKKWNARRLHASIGVFLAVVLLFLSVTGLTWSRWAGENIDVARAALGWVTPSVSTQLNAPAPAAAGHHEEHAQHAPATLSGADPSALLDAVERTAREAGIDSPFVEFRPARAADQAWLIREYDRSWPTQVDTIAVDANTMSVVSRADFETFPLIAKLIRWGIDAHMGILFGLANQIVLALVGVLLSATTILGYLIWWRRRPAAGAFPSALVQTWVRLSGIDKAVSIVLAVVLGWALPLLGASLVAFLAVDVLRWRAGSRRAALKAA